MKNLMKMMAAGTAGIAGLLCMTAQAQAQAGTQYIGQIAAFGGNFCPRGWANTDGQLLPIAQNTALFAVIGTIYGGDGRTTLGLPDLKGRRPISAGSGAGIGTYPLGQKAGTTTFTLTTNNLPLHNHAAGVQTANAVANTVDPRLAAFGRTTEAGDGYVSGGTPAGRAMAEGTVIVGNTGGGQSVQKLSPFQVVRWCIAITGVFPSRS